MLLCVLSTLTTRPRGGGQLNCPPPPFTSIGSPALGGYSRGRGEARARPPPKGLGMMSHDPKANKGSSPREARPGLQRDINQEPAQGKSHLGKFFCFGRGSSFAASRSFRPLTHSHYCSIMVFLSRSFPSLNAVTVPALRFSKEPPLTSFPSPTSPPSLQKMKQPTRGRGRAWPLHIGPGQGSSHRMHLSGIPCSAKARPLFSAATSFV